MSETIGGEVVPDSTRQLDVDGEIDLMIEDLDLWYGDKQALVRRFTPDCQEQRNVLNRSFGMRKKYASTNDESDE